MRGYAPVTVMFAAEGSGHSVLAIDLGTRLWDAGAGDGGGRVAGVTAPPPPRRFMGGVAQPLAGEYGMHNGEPMGKTHRKLFSEFYTSVRLRSNRVPPGSVVQ